MKLDDFQIAALRSFRTSDSPDADAFNHVWNMYVGEPRASYEGVMDIKSPLIDRVRVHLVACMVAGEIL